MDGRTPMTGIEFLYGTLGEEALYERFIVPVNESGAIRITEFRRRGVTYLLFVPLTNSACPFQIRSLRPWGNDSISGLPSFNISVGTLNLNGN